jgi:transcriptional regulator with XRE-family HTH domain
VTTPDYQVALGRKIAEARRRRGLSQPDLARMIDRSVAWVSQVERGVRKVDRMSVLETLADALEVPLSELAAEAPVVAAVNEEQPGAVALRLLLSGTWTLRAMLSTGAAPSPAELRERVQRARQLSHESRCTEAADVLGALVPELESGVRSAPEEERAELFELLAGAYQACSSTLSKLAEPEAAWIAADRSMSAAERAGNPLLVAAGAFRLGVVFLDARYYAQAAEVSGTAADALWRIAENGTPEATAMWGVLTLQRAVSAARLGDASAAYAYLDRARAAAERVGPGRDDYGTEFGPANVALYEIAVAVDLGDAGRALRVADSLDTSGLSPERRTRMLVDVAAAHAQRRQVADAIAALNEAARLTPEAIRTYGQVRQVISDLLAMQNPPSAELVALSRQLTHSK